MRVPTHWRESLCPCLSKQIDFKPRFTRYVSLAQMRRMRVEESIEDAEASGGTWRQLGGTL